VHRSIRRGLIIDVTAPGEHIENVYLPSVLDGEPGYALAGRDHLNVESGIVLNREGGTAPADRERQIPFVRVTGRIAGPMLLPESTTAVTLVVSVGLLVPPLLTEIPPPTESLALPSMRPEP
jgi:hypothetical protein